MKICPGCDHEFQDGDFLGRELCYHCVYREKIRSLEKKNGKWCKECGCAILVNRWIYCSAECASLGWKVQKLTYWTERIR